jgi:hypothetical protein
MTFARAVPGFVAALIALASLAPVPASAALVYHTSLICAQFDFGLPESFPDGEEPFPVTQSGASGIARLETSGANVVVTFKASGLPSNSPALCALACVLNGAFDFLDFTLFEPCTTTSASGKLTFNASLPLAADPPFAGGCVVPAVAFVVLPEEGSPVVCAPGFGTLSFLPAAP